MPRKAQGPRLYWRRDKQIWIIRDTGCPDRSTGTRERREAERALAAYIASKDTVTGSRRPDQITVAEILDIYAREKAPHAADPARIGYAIDALVPFWGGLSVADIKGETCRRYQKSRVRVVKDGPPRPIGRGTVRRELGALQAAINYAHKEGYLLNPATVTLPEKPKAKDRWLTRDEAARLIWSAYRNPKAKHLARFILIGLYTGTRKEAILKLGFQPSLYGGWIDAERGLMHRMGAGERETNKKRKPIPMINRLAAHCRRWHRMGARWAVETDGQTQRLGNIKTAFGTAARNAGLEDVTPHTLKHTAITWAIQRGLTAEDAADYFDTTAETIRNTYYHHSPHYQQRALAILNEKL